MLSSSRLGSRSSRYANRSAVRTTRKKGVGYGVVGSRRRSACTTHPSALDVDYLVVERTMREAKRNCGRLPYFLLKAETNGPHAPAISNWYPDRIVTF